MTEIRSHADARLIRHDVDTGVKAWVHIDDDMTLHFYYTQEGLDNILAANARTRADAPLRGHLAGNTQRHRQHIAEIPRAVYQGLVTRYGKPRDNPREWARIMNDPSFRDFRVGGGYIAPTDMAGR